MEVIGQLADGRGFPNAVDPHHQNYSRMSADTSTPPIVFQHFRRTLFQKGKHVLCTADFFAFCCFADLIDQLFGGFHAHISGEQDHLQFFQKILVYFGRHTDQFADTIRKVLPGFCQAGFQRFKKAHEITSFHRFFALRHLSYYTASVAFLLIMKGLVSDLTQIHTFSLT